jgi:crossover junction endodeoxyribonuclease RusA
MKNEKGSNSMRLNLSKSRGLNYLKAEIIPPSVNSYWRSVLRGGRIIHYVSKEGKAFKNALSLIARANKFKLLKGDVILKYKLYCKKQGRKDLDNTLKAVQDALEGIAYENDKQIKRIEAEKISNAGWDGIEITVEEV